MSHGKLNILVLYACSEYPFRKTFQAFMDSFRKYSGHKIHYVNYPFFFPKTLLDKTPWDIVIFTHSFTAPWNRERYKDKIETIKQLDLGKSTKICFFQDEYFNTDLTNLFIEELGPDLIYTVAPESEWSKLYPAIPHEKLTQYLTGYIEEDDIGYAENLVKSLNKDITLSYRTAYPGPLMTALGEIGLLKYEVAEFGKKLNLQGSDIQVGSGFLVGEDWFKFLGRSKFILGVPSGANILDHDGSIAVEISKLGLISRLELTQFLESKGLKQDYNLEVISPRIFEAGLFDCCQILVEGTYNDILKKDVHYIGINRDLSNLKEVKDKVSDEEFVKSIVQNFRNDILKNKQLHYRFFIQNFFSRFEIKVPNTQSRFLPVIILTTYIANFFLRIYSFRTKLKLFQQKIKHSLR